MRSAYVSTREHTSAFVSIRQRLGEQHLEACLRIHVPPAPTPPHTLGTSLLLADAALLPLLLTYAALLPGACLGGHVPPAPTPPHATRLRRASAAALSLSVFVLLY